ncbi:MAG TPA: rod shape-determining protein MreC [Caldilineaceae bacterium]|nr:rod shape-determining protein MreC [Caldilineaceae bacterium]HRW10488.1 rod shape-determining protein MreC [Caldilineaceae bacterium]
MRSTDRQRRPVGDLWLRLLILMLAALLLMALQLTGQLSVLRSAVSVVTSPAQLATTGVGKNVTDALTFLWQLRTLRQRTSELEEINASLRAEIFRLSEVERENENLRRLLAFAETRPGLQLRGAQIVARVIGQESTNFLEYIEVDLGAQDGIEEGMPVLTEQGLVGRISEVNNTTAKVLLITDDSSNVNAILQSSRLNGIVQGTPSGDLLMDFIPQGPVFSVGEVVLTSGIGLSFPRGIPIGRVLERRQRDIDIFQQAVVRPIIDFRQLEVVAIVTNFDPLENVPDVVLEPTEALVPETIEPLLAPTATPEP